MCKPKRLMLWALALTLGGLALSAFALCLRPVYGGAGWALDAPAVQAVQRPPAAAPVGEINVNTADVKALCALTGVGPALAQRIIDERETNGRFAYGEDLLAVKGIGQKTWDKLKGQYCLD